MLEYKQNIYIISIDKESANALINEQKELEQTINLIG